MCRFKIIIIIIIGEIEGTWPFSRVCVIVMCKIDGAALSVKYAYGFYVYKKKLYAYGLCLCYSMTIIIKII